MGCIGGKNQHRISTTATVAVALVGLSIAWLAPARAGSFTQTATAPTQDLDRDFKKKIRPLFEKYCTSCHGGSDPTEGFALDKVAGVADVLKRPERWQLLSFNLKSKSMPPGPAKQPTDAERQEMLDWSDTALTSNCNLADPGRVTIRRLNRVEYRNTVRDLLGVDLDVTADFPSDDVGYGFDSIGDVLSTSALHLEKYMAAAERLSHAAIQVREPKTYHLDFSSLANSGGSLTNEEGGRSMFTNDQATLAFNLPDPGDYRLRIRAYGDQAGSDFPNMSVRLNGQLIDQISIKNEQAKPGIWEIPVSAKAGRNEVSVGFTNDFYDPTLPDPNHRDRNLIVNWVEMTGPSNLSAPISESQRTIIFAYPGQRPELDTARLVLQRFASRAYRRPASPDEVDRLLNVYKQVRGSGGSYERGIQVCVAATLCSPSFLFRAEMDAKPREGEKGYRLSNYEFVSRLSYFLWSSMPDAELSAYAQSGQILDRKILDLEINRMLKSPKIAALCENFTTQWLELRKLEIASPDPKQFPDWKPGLKKSMQQEAVLFFQDVLQGDHKIDTFLDANYTFANHDLATLYGLSGVDGDELRKVAVDPSQRGGLLGMAGVLTVTSNPNRTSPVKRGKWVLEQILGTPPPPPPPNVGALAEDQKSVTTKTIKERLAQHRKNPACATCHKSMDAMGFSLENFDPIGEFRTKDSGFQVDSVGELANGTQVNGFKGLKAILLSRKVDFLRSLAEKLTIYATGRGLRPVDRCQIDTIVKETEQSCSTLKSMLRSIILSDLFRMRTPPQKTP